MKLPFKSREEAYAYAYTEIVKIYKDLADAGEIDVVHKINEMIVLCGDPTVSIPQKVISVSNLPPEHC